LYLHELSQGALRLQRAREEGCRLPVQSELRLRASLRVQRMWLLRENQLARIF
jgi:hypothetical protein